MVKIKLCGLSRLCDIEWANEDSPDYVGFVFAGEKRCVSDDQAEHLRQLLDPAIQAVGVFVNDSLEHIQQVVRRNIIQLVQIHGQESEQYISLLRERISVPIIQAFSIRSERDIELAERSTADYILLDNGNGGTGRSFDWSYIARVKRPYFLAGGLTPDNAAAASSFHPYAVDVSSGVETNGVKDRHKIKQFIAQVRSADVQQEEML